MLKGRRSGSRRAVTGMSDNFSALFGRILYTVSLLNPGKYVVFNKNPLLSVYMFFAHNSHKQHIINQIKKYIR